MFVTSSTNPNEAVLFDAATLQPVATLVVCLHNVRVLLMSCKGTRGMGISGQVSGG
jgi:hypothetical protein